RSVGTKLALDGLREEAAEVRFVFGVCSVADSFCGVKIPILGERALSGPHKRAGGGRKGMNFLARRQMYGRRVGQPAGDVFFVQREILSCKTDDRIKNRAPGNLSVVEPVVEMLGADGIFGEEQRARTRSPDRNGPVAHEFSETILAPSVVSGGDNSNVGRVGAHKIA